MAIAFGYRQGRWGFHTARREVFTIEDPVSVDGSDPDGRFGSIMVVKMQHCYAIASLASTLATLV